MMSIGAIVLALILLPYVVLTLMVVKAISDGGTNEEEFKNLNVPSTHASIILPVRNEASNILGVLESIRSQRTGNTFWKLILVDDHSEDKTTELADTFISDYRLHKQITIISLADNDHGKKRAIEEGLKYVGPDEIVITIDADCTFGELWLQNMLAIRAGKNADVVIGMAIPDGDTKSFIYNFEIIESLGINGINILMTSKQKPIVASGANLLFHKNFHPGNFQFEHPSGDDMELLLYAKKRNASFASAFSNSTVAKTKCAKSIKSLINQRLRWASKRFVYSDLEVKLIGAATVLGNLTLYLAILLAFNNLIFMALPIIKILLDFSLCRAMSKKLDVKFSGVYFILIELIYPIYIIFIPCISGIININWKERTINRDGKERAGILF